MKKFLTPAVAIAATVALAACGSGGSSGSTSSAAGSGTGKTVSVRQLSGVGKVLVDPSGKALYASDLEASGKVVCSDAACTAFWKPLTLGAGQPTAAPGAGKLGMITRPDGSHQVTTNGKPLYTFSEDSAGKATGDGFADEFGGHHFTWHVVRAGGTTPSGSGGAAPDTSGSSDSGSDSDSYGY